MHAGVEDIRLEPPLFELLTFKTKEASLMRDFNYSEPEGGSITKQRLSTFSSCIGSTTYNVRSASSAP